MWVKKQQIEPYMEQWTGTKLGEKIEILKEGGQAEDRGQDC